MIAKTPTTAKSLFSPSAIPLLVSPAAATACAATAAASSREGVAESSATYAEVATNKKCAPAGQAARLGETAQISTGRVYTLEVSSVVPGLLPPLSSSQRQQNGHHLVSVRAATVEQLALGIQQQLGITAQRIVVQAYDIDFQSFLLLSDLVSHDNQSPAAFKPSLSLFMCLHGCLGPCRRSCVARFLLARSLIIILVLVAEHTTKL